MISAIGVGILKAVVVLSLGHALGVFLLGALIVCIVVGIIRPTVPRVSLRPPGGRSAMAPERWREGMRLLRNIALILTGFALLGLALTAFAA